MLVPRRHKVAGSAILVPMGLRKRIRRQAASHLNPGETIQAVFPTGTQYRLDCIVVVTSRRILVFQSSRVIFKIKSLKKELPRNTRLGPTHGRNNHGNGYACPALGPHQYIYRRWFADVEAADAAIHGPNPILG
jgi:hypothetical protein